MRIKVQEVSFHRNGIAGVGFYAVRFATDIPATTDRDAEIWGTVAHPEQKDANFLAIVFDTPGECALICLDRIPTHGIKFGANSWRGDTYESELRKAINGMESSGSIRVGPFALPTT